MQNKFEKYISLQRKVESSFFDGSMDGESDDHIGRHVKLHWQ